MSARLNGLRVLVVEDEPDSRELLGEFLSYEGAEVVTAEDAAHGMEALLRFKPSVLLSDIGMPGEDGHAFIRRCRQLEERDLGSIPAIAVTAFGRPEDRARSLAAGFNEHLCKPIDLSNLVTRILQLTLREASERNP
ncbi:MAG TPA: response regulator [Polyangiaceae bacterium]|nr:response regulator [Polyangiaceae bacterium]